MLVEEETSLRAELGALRNVTTPESLAVEPIEPALDQLVPLHAAARALDSAGTLATHPRLAARRGALEAARATIRVEALAARPDLTVGARYATRPIASDFFSIALGVRLPVWAGRKQHRLADAARQETAAAEAALAEEERRLEAELRSVRVSVAAGRQRIELLATQVVPSAHETAHAALRSYRVGQVDFLSYLAAEDSRYRAELEVASATADHLTHLVMLEQLLGPEVEP
jgi:outer membrane protein TolC